MGEEDLQKENLAKASGRVVPLQRANLREKKEKKRGEEEQQPQKCARRRAEDEALNPASYLAMPLTAHPWILRDRPSCSFLVR